MNIQCIIKKIKNKTPNHVRKIIKTNLKKYRIVRNNFNYKFLKKSITKSNVIDYFKEIGIEKGDTILVHSSLSRLGNIKGGSDCILQALLESVGTKGNVGAPTFWGLTKDYLSGNVTYDVLNSPSILGAVTEKIRKHPGARRSLHPTHSVAFIGPDAENLTMKHHMDKTPFGPNSPYAKLIEYNGKILLLGVSFEYMTSLHTIEDYISDFKFKVYRQNPIIFNVIDQNGRCLNVESYIHCQEAAKVRNSYKLKEYFIENKIFDEIKFGMSSAKLVKAKELHETLLKLYENGVTMYY